MADSMFSEEMSDQARVLAQFKSEDGHLVGVPFDLPEDMSVVQLNQTCNGLLGEEDDQIYTFYIEGEEVRESLSKTLNTLQSRDSERILEILYIPQATFRVQAVTRCSASMGGHTEAVITVAFSPDGTRLASGSGDGTVRMWDIQTQTPEYTCKGHTHWILVVSWSPDGRKVASACKRGQISLWDPVTGDALKLKMNGHTQWVTWMCWEPQHRNGECRYFVSASKDSTVRVWDSILFSCTRVLAGHTAGVTCVKWGGEGLIYSSSQDRSVKVWRAEDGTLCRTLTGHAHWVNTLALNTDYLIRLGSYDPGAPRGDLTTLPAAELQKRALDNYTRGRGSRGEALVSGSDDFTLFLWSPVDSKKSIARMTGHQQLINDVKFSPNMRLIASASFDKSVKLWDGSTGVFVGTMRGHVGPVYQISWSADSRLLCSGRSDSPLKVWNIKTKKLWMDLPGHADEVFAVDWSPDGERVASGGRDKVIKIWRK